MTWFLDAAERLLKTFVQAFLAQILASGLDLIDAVQDTTTLEQAAVAGIAAVLSLIFSVVSKWANTDTISPASLVPE